MEDCLPPTSTVVSTGFSCVPLVAGMKGIESVAAAITAIPTVARFLMRESHPFLIGSTRPFWDWMLLAGRHGHMRTQNRRSIHMEFFALPAREPAGTRWNPSRRGTRSPWDGWSL